MKILALDSSGMTATVAVAEDDRLLAEYSVNYKKTHSQTLLPMLAEICRMTELDLRDVDAIAVSGGPGSFTGLRIGSATAKGLGLALDKPLIHIPTLEGMAWQAYGTDRVICPMMDARRAQVYTALYQYTDNRLEILLDQTALSIEEIIQKMNETGKAVFLLGDGTLIYEKQLREGLQVPYLFAPSYMNQQRAGAVAFCGMQYYKEGKTESARDHRPDYLRVSQAERERAVRLSAGRDTEAEKNDRMETE